MKTIKGKPLWNLVPCDAGFGEWEATGKVFVRRDSIVRRPELDGLIHNQTGPAVSAVTWDGDPVTAMLP